MIIFRIFGDWLKLFGLKAFINEPIRALIVWSRNHSVTSVSFGSFSSLLFLLVFKVFYWTQKTNNSGSDCILRFVSQESLHGRFKELLHLQNQLKKRVEDLRKELVARQNHSEAPRVASPVVWRRRKSFFSWRFRRHTEEIRSEFLRLKQTVILETF